MVYAPKQPTNHKLIWESVVDTICLINSPSLHKRAVSRSMAGGLGFDGGDTMVLPPLELAIEATILREAGYLVELIDADPLKLPDDEIYAQLQDKTYSVIIATASLPTLDDDSEFLRGLKKSHPEAKVFAQTMIADRNAITQLLMKSGADLVLHGEPELLLPEIISGVERRSTAWLGKDTAPYLSNSTETTLVFKPSEPVSDLNALPLPARDLLPNQNYVYPLLGAPVATLQTSRGCPFPCGYYCPYPLVQGKKFRPQSPQRVFKELRDVVENYKIRKIYFRDATFTLDNKRTEDLCDLIIEAGMKIEWMCETRVDRLTDDLLEKMHRAGCVGVLVGVETGDETVMHRKEGKKGLTVDRLSHLRQKASELGIKVHYLLIVGLPHETKESTIATYELIMAHKPDTAGVTIITPYPGTPLFADATREGWIDSFDWENYGGHQIVMHTPGFSHTDLQKAKTFLDEAFAIVQYEQRQGASAEIEAIKEQHYRQLLTWAYELEPAQHWAKTVEQEILSQAKNAVKDSRPTLSVIIPTYNRSEILMQTLKRYASQTLNFEQFEVIVVDDGSSDDTCERVKSFKAPFKFKFIAEKHLGANGARNIGIRAAIGDILLITGDDMMPDANFLSAHMEFHIKHPDIKDAMVGHIDWSPQITVSPLMQYITSAQGGQQFAFETLSPGQSVDYRYFYTSNVSVKRQFLLQQETLFDLDFTYPVYDDVELGYRLFQQGMRLVYQPLAQTYHHHNITTKSFAHRQRMAGHMVLVLVAKHPELRQLFMPTSLPEGLTENSLSDRLAVAAEMEKLNTSKFSTIAYDNSTNYKDYFEQTILYPFFRDLLSMAYLLGIAEARGRDAQKTTVLQIGILNVSIVIPVFNKVELTQQCLTALYQNTSVSIGFEVIIIDNASSDDTPQFLQQAKKQYPNLRVISNAENIGFAGACNQGAQAANGEYVLFLNNDTEVQPGWLLAMLEVFHSQPDVGTVGSKLLYPDGTVQHAGVIIVNHKMLDIPLSPWHVGYQQPDLPALNHLRRFPAVTAACMLIKKSVFDEVGGFDESYWNGYEDVDLCFKVTQAGYNIFYQPESVVIHYESQSGAERFAREDENLQILQERWQGKIIADYVLSQSKEFYVNHCVIIVTYNSESSIRMCLDSVLENTHLPVAVVVVDNASTDGTRAILAEYGNRINTILNDENLGFSAACNQGIRATVADYVVLLNPDTLVTPGWLGQMLAHFAPDVGAVGPLSDYVAGRQKFQLYLPEKRPAELNLQSLMDLLRRHNHKKSVETKLLIGFCMVLSRAALDDVGLLDEALFLGNDDLDISWRLRNAGYKLLVATDTFVHHEGQVSFKTEAKSKTDALVQQSTDRLYEKLVAHYGEGNVPPPLELWEMDWFKPTHANFRQPLPEPKPQSADMTSIIILVHNQLELTMDCLDSIAAHIPEPHEIIIVDNASTDGTPAFLRQYLQNHRHVRVIRNEENVGFAAGNNQALTLAHGNFVVFLNNDTVVPDGWLGKMLAVMAQYPEVGIVGPVSNSVSGPQQITPAQPYSDIDGFLEFSSRWAEANRGKSTEFFRIVGFCLLARRDVIDRIGGWDERYNIGNFEDDDFCIRAALAGFKARIAQEVFIHHIGGQTFKELSIDYKAQIHKNWQIFSEKWHIPGTFEQGINYHDVVMAQSFPPNYLVAPLPDAASVLPLEVSRKASSLVVILNTAEAESAEACAAALSALRAQLPENAEAEIWLADDGCTENIPADIARKPDAVTALADALAVAKTVLLVSADVVFARDGLSQLLTVAESQPTTAALTPLADHALDVHQIELPDDETAFDDFAAGLYRKNGEETTPVPYAGGFCLLLKAHHVRVAGGFAKNETLPAALAELFRNLQRFGFAVARADGIVVRHARLSDTEGAQMAQTETDWRQVAEAVAAQTAHGTSLLAQGNAEQAIDAFKKAVELAPDDMALKNQLGLAYFQTGNTPKAKKTFQRVLAHDAENLHAHLFLLDLFRGEKRYRKAITHAKSALEIDPFNVDVLVAYGLLMLDLDDVDGAEMAWQRLANAPSDNPGVLALMNGLLARGSRRVSAAAMMPEIDAAVKAENWERAETLLQTALGAVGSSDAEKAALWNRLGTVHFAAGNTAEAVVSLEAGEKLDPQNTDILSNLAEIYFQRGDLDRATAFINRVMRIDPTDTNILMLLGNCAIQLEDLDVARMAFQRVQELAPDTAGINELVQELAAADAEPLPVGATAVPDGAVSTAEMMARAEAAQSAGQWEEAAHWLSQMVQATNGNNSADNRAWLNQLGVAQFMAGNLSGAEEAFCTVLDMKPDDRASLGNLADVFAAQGNFDAATEYLNRILTIDPDDVPTLMSLGNCAIQLDALDVAQMAFERVQTLAPETEGVGQLVSELRAITAAPAENSAPDLSDETPTAPIFVGGAGRSGTTLVRVMLDSHPHIACGPEMKILPIIGELFARLEMTLPPVMDEYRLDDERVNNAFHGMISQMLEPYLRQSGKRRIAEKTPHNVAYPQLHRMFPDSPLIHVIRDGRDVVASLLKMDWIDVSTGERMSITTDAGIAAQYWVEMVTAARRAIAADDSLRQRYVEIFYEELVAHPEPVMRQLFDFLGEPWDASVLEFHAKPHSLGGESSAEQVSQPINSRSVGRWRTDLSAEQQAAVKAVAGDLLIELGYARDLEW